MRKKREYFFEDETKSIFLSKAGETVFEVSLDGSLTRSFEDMEFILSLPILRGKGKSELAEFLPKRGEDSSTRSSENDEKSTKRGECECLERYYLQAKDSEGQEDRDSSEENQKHPSFLQKRGFGMREMCLESRGHFKAVPSRSHGENG